MHPHARLFDTGGIGNEDELIALAQTVDDARALAEDGPVDGGLEARRIGEDGRHGTPPGRSGRARPSHNSMSRPAFLPRGDAPAVPARRTVRDPEPGPLVTDMSLQSPAVVAHGLSLRGSDMRLLRVLTAAIGLAALLP